MTALVEARGLDAGYGGVPAVRNLDLDVGPGEVVVLLAPNGAGKTTTLLTLAGALKPIKGTISLGGRPTKAPRHRRAKFALSIVTEERSVIMGLTTIANLRLGQGDPGSAVALFPELEPLLHRTAGQLSGGEQQILALARALAAEPKVLLADKLSLGLAPMIVQRLLRAVREAADRGVGPARPPRRHRAYLPRWSCRRRRLAGPCAAHGVRRGEHRGRACAPTVCFRPSR